MPNGDHPDELSPEYEDPNEIQEEAEDARESYDPDLAEIARWWTGEAARLSTEIAALEFPSDALTTAQTIPAADPNEDAASDDGRDPIDQINESIKRLMELNGSSDGTDDNAASCNTKRWLAALGIGIVAGVGVLFEELYRSNHKKGDADVPLSDDEKKTLRQLADSWKSVDDARYWNNLASYILNTRTFTLADGVYFMQYTQQIFPLEAPFLWDSFKDKYAIVMALKAEYSPDDKSGIAAVVKALPEQQYRNAALPRTIQASCGELALADLAREKSPRLLVTG